MLIAHVRACITGELRSIDIGQQMYCLTKDKQKGEIVVHKTRLLFAEVFRIITVECKFQIPSNFN